MNKHKTKGGGGEGNAWRDVDFFLRLHCHLPDDYCGGLAIGNCEYRRLISHVSMPINIENERIDTKRRESPGFIEEEKKIQEAVKKHWEQKGLNPSQTK